VAAHQGQKKNQPAQVQSDPNGGGIASLLQK
jgi:hypothetical protein